MKSLSALLVASVFLHSAAFPQADFRFSGYAVTFPICLRMDPTLAQLAATARNQFVDVTRLRLRASLGLWHDAFLMVEHEINATYFSTPHALLQPAARSRLQVVDLMWQPVSEKRWRVLHYVDRLFLRQSAAPGELTVGRQRISWGTGRVWNPTDLFNPINPVSFSKIEKDGVDAVLAKIFLGSFSDVSIAYSPADDFSTTNLGWRIRSNTGGYDFSVMGGTFDNRIVVGADFAGSVLDAGVRGEGILSARRGARASNVVKYILGVDNQFTSRLYALVEYYYNGEGKRDRSAYELERFLKGEILNLGKQYLTVQASYLFHPLVSGMASVTRSFTDRSGFVAGSVVNTLAAEMTLAIGGQYFFGKEFDEYRYYPATVYMRVDVYF